MPYDKNLDACLFSKVWDAGTERLTVSVHSYNNGPKKLQIVRQAKAGDEFKYVKLGRLSKQELEAVLPLIQEAMPKMD